MTIHIEKAPRTMTRETWRSFFRLTREYGGYHKREDALEERAALAAKLQAAVVDGKIAIVSSGMDCDCSQYVHAHTHDFKGVVWYERLVASEYEWADGPLNVGFCKPAEKPDNSSRDLALEAYEDGRPHLISAAL